MTPPLPAQTLDLSSLELQQLLLAVGSKKALGTYLGLDRRALATLWGKAQLLEPTAYLRSLPLERVMSILSSLGSVDRTAEYFGVSASFFKNHLRSMFPAPPVKPLTEDLLHRTGSVRLVARLTGHPESTVRQWVKEESLEHHIRYDFSSHNNAKGRRAEIYWASQQPVGDILEDCNVTSSTQHPYDYVSRAWGLVNVKSSKQYVYTAQTRAANKSYWKFSTAGLQNADAVALVAYDERMEKPLHTLTLAVTPEMVGSSTIRMQFNKDGTYAISCHGTRAAQPITNLREEVA